MDPKEFEQEIKWLMTTSRIGWAAAVKRVEKRITQAEDGSFRARKAMVTQADLHGTPDYIATRVHLT